MKDRLLFLASHPLYIFTILLSRLPYFSFIRDTADYQCNIDLATWFNQKVLNKGGNRKAYWPMHHSSEVYDVENILVGIDAYPGIMRGCYIQGLGGITIGDYTQIAPHVAIVSANHNVYDGRKHITAPIHIGKYCWLGAGCKIMPGVELGDWTVVGAGAVVTKSFPDGYCIIGGVPASKIKDLEKDLCKPFQNRVAYNGYIRSDKFSEYRRKYLKI
jgi:acetyltransferase-like isoleucine patch superfamily enzyme